MIEPTLDWLRKRKVDPELPHRIYRFCMAAIVLLSAIAIIGQEAELYYLRKLAEQQTRAIKVLEHNLEELAEMRSPRVSR